MSVYDTEAHKRITSAKEHLAQAYADLLVVLDEKTTGHDQLKDTYIDRIHAAVGKVREIKATL